MTFLTNKLSFIDNVTYDSHARVYKLQIIHEFCVENRQKQSGLDSDKISKVTSIEEDSGIVVPKKYLMKLDKNEYLSKDF